MDRQTSFSPTETYSNTWFSWFSFGSISTRNALDFEISNSMRTTWLFQMRKVGAILTILPTTSLFQSIAS